MGIIGILFLLGALWLFAKFVVESFGRSKKQKRKVKLENWEVENFEPLKGFEKCSPQFQAYMRKEIAAGRVKPKTEEQGEFEDATYEYEGSTQLGKRGGRFELRYSRKTGKPYRHYF